MFRPGIAKGMREVYKYPGVTEGWAWARRTRRAGTHGFEAAASNGYTWMYALDRGLSRRRSYTVRPGLQAEQEANCGARGPDNHSLRDALTDAIHRSDLRTIPYCMREIALRRR